jgi:HEPN domain-containing protein
MKTEAQQWLEQAELDEHYMRPRYPDARSDTESGYDNSAAQEALKQAQTVLVFAKGILP